MGSAQPTLGPKGRELLLLVHYTGEEHSVVQITDFTPSPGDTCTSSFGPDRKQDKGRPGLPSNLALSSAAQAKDASIT